MKDYDHFRGYLHSKSLRWSYGAMKGRMADGWQKTIAEKPLKEFVAWLSLSEFSGIYLDRFGYRDSGADLEGKLSKLLNIKPVVSSDKRLVFFNMAEFNQRTVKEREKLLPSVLLSVWTEGFSYLEDTGQGTGRWCSSEGKLYIYNISNKQKLATLEMILATGHEKFSNLTIASPAYSGELKVNRDGKFFSQTIRVSPGILVMRFKSDAKRFRVMNYRLMEGQVTQ
jgi:phosphoglycerol transferase